MTRRDAPWPAPPDGIADALAVVASPPGVPGSARARYGAAMTLYQAGAIGAEVLEVFRILSPLDDEDPAALLAARGLRRPGAAADPGAAVAQLVAEADRCLAALAGPGLAEVRAGLAAARPVAAAAPRAVATVETWLPPALAAAEDAALAAAIRAAAGTLAWQAYAYADPAIGPAFPRAHAFAPLAHGADFELGLFLIAPGTLYRDHAHAAPELYLPLTGPHRWRFAPGAPLVAFPALRPVWNAPHAPHAILPGTVPFLCLYGWTQDVAARAYMIPADDWDRIEGG